MSIYLPAQEYLESHSLEEFEKEHGIDYHIDKVSNKICSINYNQIYSKKGLELTDQCRGVILARPDYSEIKENEPLGKTVILNLPFSRFFNEGDSVAAQINYMDPETKFFHKLDGSIISCYFNHFENQWFVSSRSVPRANVPLDGFEEYTFEILFKEALYKTLKGKETFQDYTKNLNKDFTYMFELTTPLNRVVIEYKEFLVHLIGIRDKITGQEYWTDSKDFYGVPVCPSFSLLETGTDLAKFVNSKNGSEFEGLVVRDKNFKRLKVKNVSYVYMSSAKDLVVNSPRGLLQLILLEKIDDIEPLLSDYHKNKIKVIKEKLISFNNKINVIYGRAKLASELEIANPRKGFALEVQKQGGWMACLISMFLNKADNLLDYINKSKLNSVEWSDSFLDQLYVELNKC